MDLWKMIRLIFFTSLIPMATACKVEESSQLNWGHLNLSSLNPDSPQYLINHKPNTPYRVCVPRYMMTDFPGIEHEIYAAINIWAHYIGRKIPVHVIPRDLPRPRRGDRSNVLRKTYYEKCGPDIDTVLGLSPIQGSVVGETGTSWRSNAKGQVVSYERHVFLRDYSSTPDPFGRTKGWISLAQLSGKPIGSIELLNNLIQRGQIKMDPRNKSLTLPVLIHEFGHVWGLCDQYEGPANCDPHFSSKHPVLTSIMGASSSISKLYLTDDDITGIRALAARDNFSRSWPGWRLNSSNQVNSLPNGEVQFLEIDEIKTIGNVAEIRFAALTRSRGGELRIQYRSHNSSSWQNATTYFPSKSRFRITDHTIRLSLARASSYQFRLALQTYTANGQLGPATYAYPK